ncbi:Gfo/Idh/MocA family oxidoreductase [Microlunatus spumicola]|uniref:Gfo/Idh/MocA family oxidoreductase n=1 Tax=Microlunatus spumicola TaxID=81499 RepID=A0ABP6WLU5_9ACTN
MAEGLRGPGTDAGAAPLRLVQVGAGGMGRAWLKNLAASPDVRLVGLVDLDVGAARRAADEEGFPGLPVAASVDELTSCDEAEALVNVTVPVAHHTVTTAALLGGLPVLSEKPLAESVSEGLSMVAASEVAGRLLMVSQSRRYWRNLAALRRQVAQLGQVGAVSCEFFKAPRFGGFREEMAHPLLVDMAIHQLDLARDLIGSEPVSVYCDSFNPAWSWFGGDAAANAVFVFEDGARFSFTGSWCAPGLETSWNGRWRVSAEGGTALWDGDGEPVAEAADGSALPADVRDEPEQIAGSLAEFVSVVRGGGVPSGEVHANVLSLAMVEAATTSAAAGRRVTIAEVLETAYATAVADEKNEEVRARLLSWPSVHEVVGRR